MSDHAIEAVGLTKSFGDVHALRRRPRRAAHRAGPARPERCRQDDRRADPDDAAAPDAGSARVAGLDVVDDAASCARRSGSPGSTPRSTRTSTASRTSRWSGGSTTSTSAEARRRADDLLERFDLIDASRPARPHVLGRHAPAPGPRGRARRRPPVHLPRRADDRPRPAQPPRAVGGHRGPRRARAPPSCSRRSTSTRPTGCRTRSRSSTTARSSPRARRTSSRTASGGERLEITVERPGADARRRRRALEGLSADAPVVDDDHVLITMPEGDGAITEVVRRLDTAGVGSRPRGPPPDARRRVPDAHRPRGRGAAADDDEEVAA